MINVARVTGRTAHTIACTFCTMLGALCLVCCQPDTTCRQNTDVVAGIVLRGMSIDSAGIAHEFASWDEITVQGVGSDSVLYDSCTNVSRILVPLRIDTNITAFSLDWRNAEDIIYFRHDNTRRFISMACGCVVYHTIDSVWCDGTWIDSVKIVNSAVEPVEQDNVRIFVTIEE